MFVVMCDFQILPPSLHSFQIHFGCLGVFPTGFKFPRQKIISLNFGQKMNSYKRGLRKSNSVKNCIPGAQW